MKRNDKVTLQSFGGPTIASNCSYGPTVIVIYPEINLSISQNCLVAVIILSSLTRVSI